MTAAAGDPSACAGELAEIEREAFAAWPAEEIAPLDGWRLRFSRGVTRRANSVWPNEVEGALSIDARIDRAESFYAARGATCAFQVGPLSRPGGLDEVLSARGYRLEAPVAVEVAHAGDLAAAAEAPGVRVFVEPRLFEGWFELSARRGRFAEVQDVYRALLDRLAGRALFALAERGGEPAAVGLGVVGVAGGPWLGLFSLLTLPAQRRRGCGRAIVAALARAGHGRGAERVYLQVERDNEAARALYGRLGFVPRYGYHYRIR